MRRALLPLCALYLAAAPAFADDSIPAGQIGGPGLALRAAKVVTAAATGAQVLDHAVVLVKDGRITDIVPARGFELPDGFELEDVGDKWLMPGLVELHNHIGTPTALFINDINDMVFLANPGLRASSGVQPNNRLLRRGVAGGVTTVLFIPGMGAMTWWKERHPWGVVAKPRTENKPVCIANIGIRAIPRAMTECSSAAQ